MARKKIILFIVEGINDKTCLEGVLEKILDSEEVRFQITEGDITTRLGIDEHKIRNEIGKTVKAFKDKYHLKPEHFLEVVHIIDTDGLFLQEDSVHYADVEDPLYMDDGIYTGKVEEMIERNKRKSAVVERMLELPAVLKTISYSVYYFSSNMDHVLHNQANLSKEEKHDLADSFDEEYADKPEEFIRLMRESVFTVKGTYEETWNFIRLDKNSVRRYSNFGVYLAPYEKCQK
ncbi:MAG: hypothetical protein K2P23_04895 [Lachnospiraceae bacterium]|nr:hypothetical protein [Lachnospiraceae bacterium]